MNLKQINELFDLYESGKEIDKLVEKATEYMIGKQGIYTDFVNIQIKGDREAIGEILKEAKNNYILTPEEELEEQLEKYDIKNLTKDSKNINQVIKTMDDLSGYKLNYSQISEFGNKIRNIRDLKPKKQVKLIQSLYKKYFQ